MKSKICKVCKCVFHTKFVLAQVCSVKCAVEKAKRDREKREEKACRIARVELRVAKESIKSRGQWIKEAQQAVNAFIRERDHGLPCISCGRDHQGQWHAGHYRPTSTNPELRFHEANIHKQCSACNNHMHGNITNYRINLIRRLGIEVVEWLECIHQPEKYTIEQLREIKTSYTKMARELKRNRESQKGEVWDVKRYGTGPLSGDY